MLEQLRLRDPPVGLNRLRLRGLIRGVNYPSLSDALSDRGEHGGATVAGDDDRLERVADRPGGEMLAGRDAVSFELPAFACGGSEHEAGGDVQRGSNATAISAALLNQAANSRIASS